MGLVHLNPLGTLGLDTAVDTYTLVIHAGQVLKSFLNHPNTVRGLPKEEILRLSIRSFGEHEQMDSSLNSADSEANCTGGVCLRAL